ncbi:thymidine kinase [Kozakia baliensis]|uniref:thymidine kinase n=1 Tax=Kozakia baliensis TaxID=153496 RepID=UPI00087BF2C7|nr:thymidine kinase [Kozakia baliensis]AOX19477.1 thymidine kinase [Kozakia baliensis]
MSRGFLTVYAGPMFAGKSAYLIEAAAHADNVLCLAPAFDVRSGQRLHSRTGVSRPARSIEEWPRDARDFSDIVIDESHFLVSPYYRGDVVADILSARDAGLNIIAGGLDTDYHQEAFPVMTRLMAAADRTVVLQARCHACGAPARWTAKKRETGHVLETGDADLYEARCDAHWTLPE